jgi:hypothetical protein
MIRKLIIDPIIPKGSFTLPGEYRDKATRKHLYLVNDGKAVITDYEYDDHRVHNIVITDGQPVTIEYNDTNKKELMVVDFLKNHPLCSTEGHENQNFARGIFRVHLQHEKTDIEISKLEKNIETALKVLSISFEEKYEMAFALGIDPRGMTHRELTVTLVGANLTGAAYSNIKTFDHFYNGIESNKKAMVYAQKAIKLGIISFDNGYFSIGGRTIGATEKDVIDLCMSDKDFFSGFIVPEVNKTASSPEENNDDYTVGSQLIKETIEEGAESLAPNATMIPAESVKKTRTKSVKA